MAVSIIEFEHFVLTQNSPSTTNYTFPAIFHNLPEVAHSRTWQLWYVFSLAQSAVSTKAHFAPLPALLAQLLQLEQRDGSS